MITQKQSFRHVENSSELLQAQALIWNRTFSFFNSMSLRCAIQLGIPDVIHNYEKPIPLTQLIAALPIHQTKTDFVERLMRILVHIGFFGLKEEGYVLTGASKLALKDLWDREARVKGHGLDFMSLQYAITT